MEEPIDAADHNKMVGILISNLVKEEDIAKQCCPLDIAIFAELRHKSDVSHLLDSFAGFETEHFVQLGCPWPLQWSSLE